MRYTPKYKISTDLKGIEIVTKQYSADSTDEASNVVETVDATAGNVHASDVKTAATLQKPQNQDSQQKELKDPGTVQHDPIVDDDIIITRKRKRDVPYQSSHSSVRHLPEQRRVRKEEIITRQAKYDEIFGVNDVVGKKDDGTKKPSAGKIIRRILTTVATILVLAIVSVYSLLFTVANGPSTTIRDLLVLSALQASATKWVPGLFLPKETVDEIWNASQRSVIEIIDPDEPVTDDPSNPTSDEWADAKDGMQFITLSRSTFKAYMLIVKDPSRVFTPTSCDFKNVPQTYGITIFQMADNYGVVAAINAGEYEDIGGMGTGDKPIGLTYSNGSCVWDDGNYYHTFIGLTKDNKLVCRESMTPAEAERLGIRDAVSFQWNNVLIEQTSEGIKAYRADRNIGTAQRTAIGQRADGAIILLVTDGRTASSIGATRNDIIDIMLQYRAVTAAMLDGGSSALMYYRDYYTKYSSKYDQSKLDKYQLMGLVNNYKAFTTPRRMPTFFAVKPE